MSLTIKDLRKLNQKSEDGGYLFPRSVPPHRSDMGETTLITDLDGNFVGTEPTFENPIPRPSEELEKTPRPI